MNIQHAHVNTASSDCDGPMYREYVVRYNDEEIAEHEAGEARGYNNFSEIHFRERVLGDMVSFHNEYGSTVSITPHGFSVNKPTDEGYSNTDVTWCEDDCEDAYSQRDVFAEMMGY